MAGTSKRREWRARFLAVQLRYGGGRTRRVRGLAGHSDPVAARVLSGARDQASARVGGAGPRAGRGNGAACERRRRRPCARRCSTCSRRRPGQGRAAQDPACERARVHGGERHRGGRRPGCGRFACRGRSDSGGCRWRRGCHRRRGRLAGARTSTGARTSIGEPRRRDARKCHSCRTSRRPVRCGVVRFLAAGSGHRGRPRSRRLRTGALASLSRGACAPRADFLVGARSRCACRDGCGLDGRQAVSRPPAPATRPVASRAVAMPPGESAPPRSPAPMRSSVDVPATSAGARGAARTPAVEWPQVFQAGALAPPRDRPDRRRSDRGRSWRSCWRCRC